MQNITEIDNKPVKVSIIIPCYNVQKYIIKCLDSLVNQTFIDFEIICINDESKDKTLEILNNYADKYPNIKVLSQKNIGPAGSRNKGIEIAKGEYIAFIDADDWVSENYIESLYNAITQNNCDISVSTIIRKRPYKEKYRVHYTEEHVYSSLDEKIKICDIPRCCYVWGKLYKAELVKNNRFKEGVYFEDVLWLPQLVEQSNKLVTVKDSVYYYRATANSIVKTPSERKQKDSYNSKKFIIKFFNNHNLEIPQKYRFLTKRIYYFLNIPILKIKESESIEYFYLFGFLNFLKRKTADERIFLNFFGVKFTIRKNWITDKQIKKINYPYEINSAKVPNIKNKYQTLEELVNTQKSIARFGDGEFNLIFGEPIPLQKYDTELGRKLKEVLLSDNENIMISIPYAFGSLEEYSENAKKFWRKYMVSHREKLYNLLNFDKQYYDAFVSRPYMDLKNKKHVKQYFEDFKQIWNNKDIVFVEGCCSALGYRNDLFTNAKSTRRILSPQKDSYEKYKEIFSECIKLPKDTLFILALGPMATVLAYDLTNFGYRALDLGHIDVEYEWFLSGATKKIPLKNKYVNECRNGRISSKITDKEYLEQIISDLSVENKEVCIIK